jgi:two-component system, response regulator PdtaR
MEKDSKVRVLVAEDDVAMARTIQLILDHAGYEHIGLAVNGQEVVDLATELAPDVILMDIQMPVMDGLDAAKIIQENRPTPIVVLTGYETRSLVEKARDSGILAYITKPPDAGKLDQAITIAMARHQDMLEMRKLCTQLERQNEELTRAMEEIRCLRGILPLCSYCKKVRDDQGYWEQVDIYIHHHTEAEISHGICPDCMEKHFPE